MTAAVNLRPEMKTLSAVGPFRGETWSVTAVKFYPSQTARELLFGRRRRRVLKQHGSELNPMIPSFLSARKRISAPNNAAPAGDRYRWLRFPRHLCLGSLAGPVDRLSSRDQSHAHVLQRPCRSQRKTCVFFFFFCPCK